TTNPEIWVMNANGSSPTQLTTGTSLTGVSIDVGSPAWSPDGTKIAYANSGAIWVMDAAGTNQHQLVGASGGNILWDPAWSPDGASITFVDYSTGANWLHEARADGSHNTMLGLGGVASPSWTSANPGASIANTALPIIGGTTRVGEPIEAGGGTWAGAEPFAFTYSWQRCNAGCTTIAGAT